MASFETIVRPVVFPNIRPTPQRSLAPDDDPDKGLCVIKGSSARTLALPWSFSVTASQSRPVEQQRRVDGVRVYQQNEPSEGGGINKKRYTDAEVANQIKYLKEVMPLRWPIAGAEGKAFGQQWASGTTEIVYYKRVEEADNIEMQQRDQIKKNPDAPE